MEEFSLCLLNQGIFEFKMEIQHTEESTTMCFDCPKLPSETVSDMLCRLKAKRQEEIEVYGWELLGQGVANNELELVGMLINDVHHEWVGERSRFVLTRYENN